MARAVRTVKLAAILIFCLAAAVSLHALRSAPVFAGGTRYELYLGTSSGEIVKTDSPALVKLFRPDVKGESARYAGDCYGRLKEQFHAKLLFCEEAAGVVNYYLYTPDLGHGVAIAGQVVNLHIAVGPSETAVGTPLIFGGF